jgi:hypothetical protein
MFATDRLEPREADWLWRTMGVVPTSADRGRIDAAISAAGLRIEDCLDLGSEPYIAQFGQAAYEIMFGDRLWQGVRHVAGRARPDAKPILHTAEPFASGAPNSEARLLKQDSVVVHAEKKLAAGRMGVEVGNPGL